MPKVQKDTKGTAINAAQQSRLNYIDFRLWFLGSINRSDIVERFGIKSAMATRDLTKYRELAPNNAIYDPSARRYCISKEFKPLLPHSWEQVSTLLFDGFGVVAVGSGESLVCNDRAPLPRTPDVAMMALLSRAITEEQVVEVSYLSKTKGRRRRQIVPCAFVDSGVRWHVRAWDRERERFGDFVINRMEKGRVLAEKAESHERREADEDWNRMMELVIVAHPDEEHPEAMELEYGFIDGSLRVQVRAAMAGYLLRLWGVDCSADHRLGALFSLFWLRNVAELKGGSMKVAPGYEK